MNFRRANNLLLVLIILVDGYVIVGPLLPDISYRLHDHHAQQQQLVQKLHPVPTKAPTPAVIQPNQLIVPSMLLDQPVFEGSVSQSFSILKNEGIWRWPASSTPDKGGNTVFLAHRFSYFGPHGAFYYLNKVSLGDEIGIWWNNQEYLYKVVSISQVPPTDTQIEDNTSQPEVTLFTCTPLWLPKDRLVVVADLETNT